MTGAGPTAHCWNALLFATTAAVQSLATQCNLADKGFRGVHSGGLFRPQVEGDHGRDFYTSKKAIDRKTHGKFIRTSHRLLFVAPPRGEAAASRCRLISIAELIPD